MDDFLLEILACPDTLSALERKDGGLACTDTEAVFPFFEGIPVLRRGPITSRESRWGEETAELRMFNYRRSRDEAMLPPRVLRALGDIVSLIVDETAPRFGVTLEISSATGLVIQALCASPTLRSMVIASEDSPHVLVGLKKRLAQLGLHIPQAICLNPRQLPFRNSTIDQVVTLAGFNNISHARTALGEVARVLRPGGMLLFAHLCLTDPDSAGVEIAEKHGLGDLLNLGDLDLCMRTFSLRMILAREYAFGKWPANPDNVIPASGDQYSLYYIRAVKEEAE